MSEKCAPAENFLLVRDGWIHELEVRLKLASLGPARLWREVLLAVIVVWAPLLILSLVEGVAYGGGLKIPFLRDYSTHIRLLISFPLLIASKALIDAHVREAVLHFVEARLVLPEHFPAFERTIQRTLRLRDSWVAGVVLILLAYGPAFSNTGELVGVSEASTWHFISSSDGQLRTGLTGLWFSFVSVSLYRLLLARWIWLFIVWAIFLWRVTRLPLNCRPSHPDRSAGLGFLGHTALFFGIVAFATQTAMAGAFANMLAYEGKTISDLKFLILGTCVLTVAFTIAPLVVVSLKLFRVKQQGIFDYGKLGVTHAEGFDRKWIRGERAPGEDVVGSPDISSLADLKSGYEIIENMKIFLIDHELLLRLAMPAVLPMLVLIATAIPAEEILLTLLHLVE